MIMKNFIWSWDKDKVATYVFDHMASYQSIIFITKKNNPINLELATDD